jgi:integrase
MPEKRITVWVQHYADRPHLTLMWVDPTTGRRKSKSAGTADEKEAEEQRGDLEADLNNGRYQEASRMNWERFRELFEAEYASALRPQTRERYGQVFDCFERLANPKTLRGVNERVVSGFAASMRATPARGKKGGMAASTIRVHLQFLRTALAWAKEQKLIPEVPAFPAVKVPRKKPQPIPAESFERLLDKAPDAQTRAFLLTGWLAGLRLSEALLLDREPTTEAPYLALDRHRIILPAEFVKGVEDQWVPLDPVLEGVLMNLPRQGRKVFRFVDARDGHPMPAKGVSERIIRLAKKAGVRLTMHTLRKGFGCRYAGKVPAQVLQKLMRHADIKTTMTYYANVDDAVEQAVRGAQRNSSRNTGEVRAEGASPGQDTSADANPCRQSE